jgi:hypothetical protein
VCHGLDSQHPRCGAANDGMTKPLARRTGDAPAAPRVAHPPPPRPPAGARDEYDVLFRPALQLPVVARSAVRSLYVCIR